MAVRKFISILIFLFLANFLVIAQVKPSKSQDSLVRSIVAHISKMDPENAEFFPLYSIQLPDILHDLESIHTLPDTTTFLFFSKDSIKSTISIAEIKSKTLALKGIVNRAMQHIDKVLYDAALVKLSIKDTASATRLLEKSIQHNPKYLPSWYELVHIYLLPQKISKAAINLQNAVKQVDTINNAYYSNLFKDLKFQVFQNYLKQIDQLRMAENFSAAFALIEEADQYCKSLKLNYCQDSIQLKVKEAHTGMMKSYLKIARAATMNKKWLLAETYINQARQYQQEQKDFILDKNAVEEHQQLLDVYRKITPDPAIAHHFKQKKDFKRRHNLSKHQEITRIKNVNPHHEPALLRKSPLTFIESDTLYPYLLEQANHLIEAATSRQSLFILDSAMQYANHHKIHIEHSHKEMMVTLVKPGLLENTRKAFFTVWRNEIPKAERVLDSVKIERNHYLLEPDSEVNAVITELENRINEKNCFNHISEFENNVLAALNLCNRKLFLEADDHLMKASNLLKDRNHCKMNDSLFQEIQKKL